jgi:putative ABC transport system permease protein
MLGLTWLSGVVRRAWGRFIAVTVGIALAVALFASIASFVAHAKSAMTKEATAGTSLDWQVEGQPGSSANALLRTVARQPGTVAALPVGFAHVPGFVATTAGSTQTTGAGIVVGLPSNYRTTFPDIIRDLAGSHNGVLIAQQTAANLQVAPGDSVRITRVGAPPAIVRVDGVVDVPRADSLFQVVGAPADAQPLAPPDNVIFVPQTSWHTLFDGMARARPDLVRSQVHVKRDRVLPRDPSAAYSHELASAKNFELQLTGAVKVGNNLAATLASARSDALYAQILFLFLGLPGVACAGLITAMVAGAGRDRRRGEQALLRARGATTRQLVGLATIEAAAVAIVGGAVGLGLAAIVGRAMFGAASFGASQRDAIVFGLSAVLVGGAIAVLSIALPALRDARGLTVARARLTVGTRSLPIWERAGLDLILLAAGGLVFWLAARSGYHLVLAPEGVPTISVSYWTLAGPALVWAGGALFIWRVTEWLLRRGRGVLTGATRPVAGPLAGTVAATMQRERPRVSRAVVLVALSCAFAASTAVFNSTYRQQGRVDALLTNGADVTVKMPPGADRPAIASQLAAIHGVRHVEPVQHRFVYVGADLQDLYGVNPTTVVGSTKLQDSYFSGASARTLMQRLAQQPDAALVSAETAKDFQLTLGDRITLRLFDASKKSYVGVPFHYAGVAREFPTAPSDSFVLANQNYISRVTHDPSTGTYLVDTAGTHTGTVAARARPVAGQLATITELGQTRRVISSALTAVDLAGLTKIELGFALVLAASSTGLALWLGFAERRRTFAIASALGAKRGQVGAFVWAESAFVTIGGAFAGAIGAALLANMLVKVLTGVFDPAPSTLVVPWLYMLVAGTIALAAAGTASVAAIRAAGRAEVAVLRES